MELVMSVTGDALKFLKLFAQAVSASVRAGFTGTVTVELHFHQGGLTRATASDKGVLDLK